MNWEYKTASDRFDPSRVFQWDVDQKHDESLKGLSRPEVLSLFG